MKGQKTAALRAMCTDWRKEIARLESELTAARNREGGVIDVTSLVIAISIRKEAVAGIEAIVGKGGAV